MYAPSSYCLLRRYLFNPYNVAACVGTSPTLLANLLCLFGLYYGQNGSWARMHTRGRFYLNHLA